MLRGLVGGQRAGVDGDLGDLAFPVGEVVGAAADEELLGVRGQAHRDLAVELGRGVAVEVGGHAGALPHEDDVMPGAQLEGGLALERLLAGVAVVEEELALRRVGAAETEMVARAHLVAVGAAGDEIARHRPRIRRQAVPEPQLDAVRVAELLQRRLRAAAGEMRGATHRPIEVEDDEVLIRPVPIVGAGVEGAGAFELVHGPVGQRLRGEDGLGVVPLRRLVLPARLARDALEEAEEGVDDARLGLGHKAGGAGVPGVVAAEGMERGRRDVALAAVGQLDVHRRPERAQGLELEAREAVDLAGDRRDAQPADTEGLEHELATRLLVQVDGLAGVDLGLALGQAVAHLREDGLRPGEPLGVGHAAVEGELGLGHREVDVVAELDLLPGRERHPGDGIGVGTEAGRVLGLAVVHPVEVAAGAVGHHGDEGLLGAEQLGETPTELAVVVGRDGAGAVVVHREVGERGDGPSVGRRDGEERELRVGRPRRPDAVGVLVARVHVGADAAPPEGVGQHAAGAMDPAAAVGETLGIGGRPADLRGREIGGCLLDGLDEAARQGAAVGLVGLGAEAAGHRGARVGVGGRDEHALGRDARRLRGLRLHGVGDVAGHEERVDHHDGEPRRAVVEHERPRVERVGEPIGHAAQERAADDDGELLWRDVD